MHKPLVYSLALENGNTCLCLEGIPLPTFLFQSSSGAHRKSANEVEPLTILYSRSGVVATFQHSKNILFLRGPSESRYNRLKSLDSRPPSLPPQTHPYSQSQAMNRDSEFSSYQNQPTDGGSDNNDQEINRLTIETITEASAKLESDNSTLARYYWDALGSEASVRTIRSNVGRHVERRLGNRLTALTSLPQITAKVPSVTCNEDGLNMVVQYYNQFNMMELGEVILLTRTG
nr:hypothetical protein L204_03615 [Cryptococcus depauperatus CBS 7855]